MALSIQTAVVAVEYGAEDLYWGSCGRVCHARSLLDTLRQSMWLYILNESVVIHYGAVHLYILTGYVVVEYGSGDVAIEYGTVDPYCGRTGSACGCRFLLGTLW